jgi:hypothetical protein
MSRTVLSVPISNVTVSGSDYVRLIIPAVIIVPDQAVGFDMISLDPFLTFPENGSRSV